MLLTNHTVIKNRNTHKYFTFRKENAATQSLPEVIKKTRAPHAVPKINCQGSSFYLRFLVKKGHNSKSNCFTTITKFGVDIFNTFRVIGYIAWQVFAQRR